MTLVLTVITPRYVVQAADRLLTKGKAVHDPVANKTIICSLKNAVIVLSYAGIAYLGRQPTDEWLAEILWGGAIGRGPDGAGPAALLMGQRPNDWTIDQAVSVLKQKLDAIPQHVINRGGLYLSLAGWRVGREPPRSFVIEIERPRQARVATVCGTPRRTRPRREFVIGRIGAFIAPRLLNAAFDRYRPSRTLNMEDVEQTFIETIRSVACKDRTVGPNVLCTMFPIDGPAICRFHPATPHAARMAHAQGENVIPVAHTPWIMSSGSVQAPQMSAGKSISDLDGYPLVLDAPAPATGIIGIAATMPRPGP
jgi:hypothetical protein